MFEMDPPRSRSGSAVSNSGSGNRVERPLPPIPGLGETTPSLDDRTAADVFNSSPGRESVDLRGSYGDDNGAEGPEANIHGVDASFLDIYPSRSSSLSIHGSVRSPYLEGVSNDRPSQSLMADDQSSSRKASQELPRSSPRLDPDTSTGLGAFSLQEFLDGSDSTRRNGSSMFEEASSQGSVVDSPSMNSTARDGEPERPVAVARQEHRNDSTRSLRAPNHGPASSQRSRVDDEDTGYDASSSSAGNSPLISRTLPRQARNQVQGLGQQIAAPPEFVLPRWQPDVEVTVCPICRTQFSFFVRKHHCRKCGRVVCNACSPHRITIPYQYIVQPPVEIAVPTSSEPRPRRTDTAGSLEVTSLGGGERVRLCNPCVPDPNTAPPVNSQQQGSYQGRHSRSASSTGVPQSQFVPPGGEGLNEYLARLGNQSTPVSRRIQQHSRAPNRYPDSRNQSRGTAFTDRGDRLLLRPDDFQSRSRSSTVGSTREQTQTSHSHPHTSLERSHSVRGHPQYRSLVPIVQSQYPRMDNQPRPPPRRRVAEDDECWVCHRELHSRDLPDYEALRQAHVSACVDAASNGLSTLSISSPSPAPSANQTPGPSPERPGLSSSSSAPAPVPNTPEGRTAAREQAHAAVVLGQNNPSPGPRRNNGGAIFQYKASEKDMVDDAECNICLEGFEVGQDMGRLECFCRFHLHCVQDWYRRQPGVCPTHK